MLLKELKEILNKYQDDDKVMIVYEGQVRDLISVDRYSYLTGGEIDLAADDY